MPPSVVLPLFRRTALSRYPFLPLDVLNTFPLRTPSKAFLALFFTNTSSTCYPISRPTLKAKPKTICLSPFNLISSHPPAINTAISSTHPYGLFSPIHPSTPLINIQEKTVHTIKDFPTYESLVYSFTSLIVCLFVSRSCTWSEVLKPQFLKAVHTYYAKKQIQSPSIHTASHLPHVFALIDVDDCPRAAYHCEITDVPTAVVMYQDDAIRKKITPLDRYDASSLLEETFRTLQDLDATPLHTLDHHTSTTAWYDHHIRLDNLNIRRVGWPEL